MGLLDRFASLFDEQHWSGINGVAAINPATGLPMAGGVDIAGDPYGTDLSRHHEGSSLFEHANWHDNWSSDAMEGGHDPWRD